jgi:hypothetical protein
MQARLTESISSSSNDNNSKKQSKVTGISTLSPGAGELSPPVSDPDRSSGFPDQLSFTPLKSAPRPGTAKHLEPTLPLPR